MTLSIAVNKCDIQYNPQNCYAECLLCSISLMQCHIQAFYAKCHYAESRYAEYRGALSSANTADFERVKEKGQFFFKRKLYH